MRVLICGGRDFGESYEDHCLFEDALKAFQEEHGKITHVVCGAQVTWGSEPDRNDHGADYMAILWAIKNEVNFSGFPAKWKRLGRKAGPMRNTEMLEAYRNIFSDSINIDFVIYFPGGAGTADMVRQAKAADVRTWEVTR